MTTIYYTVWTIAAYRYTCHLGYYRIKSNTYISLAIVQNMYLKLKSDDIIHIYQILYAIIYTTLSFKNPLCVQIGW